MVDARSPSSIARRILPWALGAPYVLLMCWMAWLATRANLDLADGRHVLFMDECITFDGVKAILHAPDAASWFKAVMDGHDHRYGRSLWNAIALVAWLPAHAFGEPGQIVAGRMTQVAWLMAACLVLSFGLLRQWHLRLTMLAAMMGMPFAAYYMTMPKPEPQQIFWLALFFATHTRRPQDAKQWLWLGLALGTKISTLPIVLVCALAARMARTDKTGPASPPADRWGPLFFFMLGFGLAVPILLPSVALATALWHGIRMLRPALFRDGVARWGLMILIGLLDFAATRRGIRTWFQNTLRNTAHGSDSKDINALSWLDYFFHQWLGVPAWLGACLVLCALALMAALVWPQWRKHGGRIIRQAWSAGALMLVCGMALNGALFVGTHRLWGFYLVPGTTLVIAGLLKLIDETGGRGKAMRITQGLSHAFVLTLLAVSLLYWLPATSHELQQLARRSQQAEHRMQLASYQLVRETLAQLAHGSGRTLEVAQDPQLYPVDNQDGSHHVREFWGPYTQWDAPVDVLLFSRFHTPTGTPTPPGTKDHAQYLIEQQEYARRVRGPGCGAPRCYRLLKTLPNGGAILVSAALAP